MKHLLLLHGLAAYAVVGTLSFAEAALFVGFVLPGETAVVLGGVLASQHAVALPVMIAVAVLSAIAGDSVGYEVGAHFGPRLLEVAIMKRHAGRLDRARAYLQRGGGKAVFLARFTAFLRAVMPALAGLARMPYRRFLMFNVAGGVVWGTGFTLLGYAAGTGYARIERIAGRFSLVLLALVIAGAIAYRVRDGRRERAQED